MAKQVPSPKLPKPTTGKSGAALWSAMFGGLFQALFGFLWKEKDNIWEWLCKNASNVVDWWKGKKIAIIGAPGAGKNCFYCRLQGKPVPNEHRKTTNPEKISQFRFERTLPDKSHFSLHCKRSVNVGGEEHLRDRHWFDDACRDADVIFYLLTVEDLRDKRYGEGSRIDADCVWLAKHLGRMKPCARVHFLVNKIDSVLSKPEDLDRVQQQLTTDLDALQQQVRSRFGHFAERLTGISPISMVNEDLFERCLPLVLKAVYDAIHPAE